MEIYLFALGLIVIALVVASVLFVNNEEKKNITISKMEIYIFGLGVFVVGLVVASVFFVNDEETKKYNDIDQANEADYDGMGNYGRFPEKKNKLFSSSLNKAFHKKYHCKY